MKKWIALALVVIIVVSFCTGLAIGWHYGRATKTVYIERGME